MDGWKRYITKKLLTSTVILKDIFDQKDLIKLHLWYSYTFSYKNILNYFKTILFIYSCKNEMWLENINRSINHLLQDTLKNQKGLQSALTRLQQTKIIVCTRAHTEGDFLGISVVSGFWDTHNNLPSLRGHIDSFKHHHLLANFCHGIDHERRASPLTSS